MRGWKKNLWIFGVLLGCVVAFLPVWPYSSGWDYSLSGRVSVVLVVFIVLNMTKRI